MGTTATVLLIAGSGDHLRGFIASTRRRLAAVLSRAPEPGPRADRGPFADERAGPPRQAQPRADRDVAVQAVQERGHPRGRRLRLRRGRHVRLRHPARRSILDRSPTGCTRTSTRPSSRSSSRQLRRQGSAEAARRGGTNAGGGHDNITAGRDPGRREHAGRSRAAQHRGVPQARSLEGHADVPLPVVQGARPDRRDRRDGRLPQARTRRSPRPASPATRCTSCSRAHVRLVKGGGPP